MKYTFKIECDTIEELRAALKEAALLADPAEDPEPVEVGMWSTEEIRELWLKLSDDARYVLGIIADHKAADEAISRDELFEEVKKYPGANVKAGQGFGGTLSSYGFATRSMGLRGKREKLYTSDETGYGMRQEYRDVILALFGPFVAAKRVTSMF